MPTRPTKAKTAVPTVKWSPWLLVQFAGAVIASWLLFGAVGFAVFWAVS